MGGIALPLAVAQIVFWVAGYYSFAALLPFWRADTGWSLSALSAGFTLSLLVTAVCSPLAGRWIDRGDGIPMTVAAAILGAGALALLGAAQALWQFHAACLLLGIARAGLLYEPCFAILTRHQGKEARGGVTRIALVAGFAGTIAFPMIYWLGTGIGWRGTCLVLAILILVAGLPAALTGYRQLERAFPTIDAATTPQNGRLPTNCRFWLLAIAFALIAVNHGMLVTHLLPLLAERGVAATLAVGVAASIGPMQVIGRLAMLSVERRVSTVATVRASFAGMILASLVLWVAWADTLLILAFAILQGAAYGVTSIARPSLTRERLGQERFGQVSGRMGAIFMLGLAIAPLFGAMVAERAGYIALPLVTAACAVMAAVLLSFAARV